MVIYENLNEKVKEFVNIFSTKCSQEILKLMETAYKGKLMILKVLACDNKEYTAGDLAKVLNVSTARIATAINSLESKGYVLRNRPAHDGRKVIIAITDTGVQALQKYSSAVNVTMQDLFGRLTDEELKTFIILCKKLFGQT